MHNIAQNENKLQQGGILHGVPEGYDALIIAQRARELSSKDYTLVHVVLDGMRLWALNDLLNFFAPDVKTICFPAWDCLPYDRVSPHADLVSARVAALSEMLEWKAEQKRYPKIVLVSLNALVQRVMPQNSLSGASISIKKGERLQTGALLSFLSANGYIRNETVRESGDFAIRGGIIDLFPAGVDNPLRVDLFGDEVESIKYFDPASQRTTEEINDFVLRPVSEFFLNEESISRFRSAYRALFGTVEQNDLLYESVSGGKRYSGMEHWLPLFFEETNLVLDYVPKYQLTLDPHIHDAYEERIVQIRDFYQSRKTLADVSKQKDRKGQSVGSVYNPLPIRSLYLERQEWYDMTAQATAFLPFGAPDEKYHDAGGRKGRDFSDIRVQQNADIFKELKIHIDSLRAQNKKVLIACYSEGSRQRLTGLMQNAAITPLVPCEHYEDVKKLKGIQVATAIFALEHGFISPDLAVLTEQDILGDRLARKVKKRKRADNFLKEVSALSEGDIVVHLDHGIGRFIELETIKAAGTLHDCLKIEYAGGDKLYVPVENLDVLSRFGGEDVAVELDKLGGAGWQARKAKARKDLMEMADQLLKIAAARLLSKAQQLQIEPEIYNEFAARFPYQETEDQERAIQEVLDSLSAEYPMDRLVCGDVGFGKTEVAMRAAFIAAMSGMQVAVVVPTTLLSRQHYNNFLKRFAGMGIRLGQLSRLVASKDVKLVKSGIEDGSIQIVIGTHALLSKDIKFHNLALLIIDEEQRFGVKQKERLKEFRNNVHVLTLTATPIPRTLQMALTGVKEMSLITTPPVDRLAVRTFVLPFDSVVIRDALLREHYRGGQSFYVVPRIKDIPDVEELLRENVPEVKFISAHGQMSPTELEDRMTAFYEGQYDVLLATNIIESGIDIPTANTMVVHRADMFGLGQLYQIRGRIGRSKLRAYAYLTYQPGLKLNPTALKRLEIMETLDALGSGFQLASHDMDIRGAGNLLGEKQSGHIREVGVELYQQMLEEAVAQARHGTGKVATIIDEKWSPQINLGTSVLIPDTYVEDLNVRMSLYRRLNDLINQDEVEAFAAELIDRFGDIPQEVENLLNILKIKQLCKQAGISQVDAGPKGAVVGFHKNNPPNVDGLMKWIQEQRGSVKFRQDQKLVVIRQWENAEQRVKGLQKIVKDLSEF